MLRQLLIFGFVFALANGKSLSEELPDIKPRTDENGQVWYGPLRKCPFGNDSVLTECTREVTRDFTPLVGKGIPEIGLPPMDPIFVRKVDFEQDVGPIKITLIAKNLRIHDLPKYKLLDWNVDTKNKIMSFIYEIPKIRVVSEYKLGGNVFFFPLTGSGPVNLEIYGLKAKGHMNFYKMTRDDGKKVMQLKNTILDDISIKDLNVRIKGLFDGNPLLGAFAHYFGNRYGPQIFDLGKADIQRNLDDIITNTLVNPVLRRYPHISGYVPDD